MKKICKVLALIVILVLGNLIAFKMACSVGDGITLRIEVSHSVQDTFQVFYSETENGFSENKTLYAPYDPAAMEAAVIEVPLDKEYPYFRFDIGNVAARTVIRSVSVISGKTEIPLSLEQVFQGRNFEPTEYALTEAGLEVSAEHADPFFVFQISQEIYENLQSANVKNKMPLILIACLIVTAAILVLVIKRDRMHTLVEDFSGNRKLIWSLAKNDFKTKYAGSALGIVWAFIQPLVTILVYWMVFQFGLRSSSPVEGVPFIVWLIAGMIPWMFFNEAMMNATACFLEYSYLVKKVVFKINILPVVKILSSFFVHAVFIGFLTVICLIYGTITGPEVLQVFYYMICMIALVVGISFITSAFNVFLKDFGQIISIIMQVTMWATPILWPSTIVPQKYQFILKLNPAYYFVEGYRDAFTCNGVWFWDKGLQTLWFWGVTAAAFIIGIRTFKRMKPHFADVL